MLLQTLRLKLCSNASAKSDFVALHHCFANGDFVALRYCSADGDYLLFSEL